MAGLTQEQKDQFFDLFKSMTIMDAAEMKKRIEDELGIEASAGAMMVAPGQATGGPAEEEEEPTEFNVTLTEIAQQTTANFFRLFSKVPQPATAAAE